MTGGLGLWDGVPLDLTAGHRGLDLRGEGEERSDEERVKRCNTKR